MEPTIAVDCIRGRNAVSLCGESLCKNSAPICELEDCECHIQHQDCNLILKLGNITKGISKKIMSYLPILKETQKLYQAMIKLFSIQLCELDNLIAQGVYNLTADQNTLYTLLRQKKGHSIKPQLVSSVMKEMSKNSKTNLVDLQKQVKAIIQKQTKEIEKIVSDTRKCWNQQMLKDFNKNKSQTLREALRFNNKLYQKDYYKFQNNSVTGSITFQQFRNQHRNRHYQPSKRLEDNPSDLMHYKILILDPSLQKRGQTVQTFQFKDVYYKYFGICHRKTVQDNKFMFNGNVGDGVYAVYHTGKTYSHIDTHKNSKSLEKQINFQPSKIQITYDPINKKVKFVWKQRQYQGYQNNNKNHVPRSAETELDFRFEKNNQLHLCVIMTRWSDNSVTFLGQTKI